ncbi:DUF2207 domain-containing protein [Aminipila butyrica]|uniref:DUF2207 domain-containing protein n=1 Tax=Aminipila butyrica TaxID=433296 RepID=A0A858BXM6_9FIRM|nr:DUF2207 domain-containing protein [Aminipila butyrica]QIB70327.1 DUF2207 domain-containing protein [Aminipila butyrica]
MKYKSKRQLILSVFFTVVFLISANSAFAAEDAIPAIDIDVIVQGDGSAVITEMWTVRGVSSGTEYYKALNNMEGMSVHSLVVKDESGKQYRTLDNWNTDLSREEKANTCGILKTSEGYELCWGIGSYGDHQYTIQYVVEGLVKNYGDYAGFYHQFLGDLSSAPEAFSVKIRAADTALTEKNARIWGYDFPGTVNIAGDGSLTAFSSEPLDGGDSVKLLCRFDKGLFPLAATAEMSFENLQKSADNDNSNTIAYVFLAGLGVVIAVAGILTAFFFSRYKLADGTTAKLGGKKQLESTWSIPFGGSISAVYAAMGLLRKGIASDKLMGAYLVRWQEAGAISLEERQTNNHKGKSKTEEVIVFHPEKKPAEELERTLYDLLIREADSDEILWNSHIEEAAERLHEKLTIWAEDVKRAGEKELINWHVAEADKKGVLRFTASGFDRAVKVLGFQKYLAEMHKLKEDNTATRKLWGDYLVFAALFGVGEQVLNKMKALDPVYFDTFAGMYGYNSYRMMYFMAMTNHISSSTTPNTNGTGGAAGFGGGGGFSGGGGGGSR